MGQRRRPVSPPRLEPHQLPHRAFVQRVEAQQGLEPLERLADLPLGLQLERPLEQQGAAQQV